jgi:hypothetical protein
MISYRLLEGNLHFTSEAPFWVLKVAVGNGHKEVEGWAFIDHDNTELRFEIEPGLEPPNGNCQHNNSLALLLDCPYDDIAIAELEEGLRLFLLKCMFSVVSLSDVDTGERTSRIRAYRYAGKVIPVG